MSQKIGPREAQLRAQREAKFKKRPTPTAPVPRPAAVIQPPAVTKVKAAPKVRQKKAKKKR